MTNKKIYVIEEKTQCEVRGCFIPSGYHIVEAFEYEDDAKLALWYWYLDQREKGADVEWDEIAASSESDDWCFSVSDRYINEINLYGG